MIVSSVRLTDLIYGFIFIARGLAAYLHSLLLLQAGKHWRTQE